MELFKEKVAAAVAKALGLAAQDVVPHLEAPKDKSRGDLALPCFKLAKPLGRSGKDAAISIAKDIAEKCEKGGFLEEISTAGPFVNFRLSPAGMAQEILADCFAAARFGGSSEGAGKTIVLDYSSPNIAKPFHLGHLRSTVIGHSIRRLYESLGYRVHGVNHLGDWGTQFGYMLAAWQRWRTEAQARIAAGEGEIDVFVDLYQRINDKKSPEYETRRNEARAWFKRLEEGDREGLDLWGYFVEGSKREFARIYAILGIKHESDAGESFYNDKMKPVVELARAKGILVRGLQQEKRDELDDGRAADARPEGVDLGDPQKGGLGFPILLKSDGGTTYITRDLAAVFYRENTFSPEKIVYVVGAPQILHFRQLKAILAMLAPGLEKKVIHVPFGQYLGMSTRRGTAVFLAGVLEQARVEMLRAADEAKKKADLTPEEIERNAQRIAVGAVRFFDLKSERTKDIDLTKPLYVCPTHVEQESEERGVCAICGGERKTVFWCEDHRNIREQRGLCPACVESGKNDDDAKLEEKRTLKPDLERLLSPKGDTGPYVQYSFARLSGVLRKLGRDVTPDVDFALLREPESIALVKLIAEHGERVRLALAEHEPSVIARHTLDLAAAANSFLHEHRVIDAEPKTRDARALLVHCARKVLGQCLDLLGIEALEKM